MPWKPPEDRWKQKKSEVLLETIEIGVEKVSIVLEQVRGQSTKTRCDLLQNLMDVARDLKYVNLEKTEKNLE